MERLITWTLALTIVSGAAGLSLPLPKAFKVCYRNDPNLNECAKANAGIAIPQLKNGIPEYGVAPLDPLYIKRIKVEKNLLSMNLDLKDVQLHGLSQSKAKDIRITHDPPNFIWDLYAPTLTFLGKYEASGQILLLPITGKGDINITLVGVDYTCNFQNDLKKRDDGEEYFVPLSSSINYEVQRVYYKLENLFNGNELLGSTMNAFLNENWKEVEGLLGKAFVEKIEDAVRSLVHGLMSKVAYNRFFPTKV